MRSLRFAPALAMAAFLASASTAHGGDDPPAWLVAASKVPVPERSDGAPAVELFRECRIRVESNGTFVSTTRRAVRILTREGKEAAIVREVYENGSGNVQDMQAWILRPAGKPIAYGKKNAIDASMVASELHSDTRIRMITADDDAEVGSVFGCESVVEFRQATLQISTAFQGRLPVLTSRLVMAAPPGWSFRSRTFHHEPIEGRREGDATVWATGGLPYLEEEHWSPPLTSLAPRIAVTVMPPDGASRGARFEDWASVALWIEELAEPQSAATPALTAKARALVEGRSGERERIEAIGSYVQGLHYISIQTGLARGGGYRPHAAADVFSKSYGDCKGKANLLRTMLREVGIRAHLVLITSDDPDYVREEWPSPYQFNHCITAIAVGESLRAPAIMELGGERFLLFDPTDPATPLGQVPFLQQGSLALVACGPSSALVRVPSSPSSDNGVERTIRGSLGVDGALTATVLQRARGGEAARRRWEHRNRTPAEYRKDVESWISQTIPGASVSRVEVKDEFRENRFSVEIEVRAPGFARTLPGGLFAVRPLSLERPDWRPRSSKRRVPLLLPSSVLSERTELRVPDGYVVEECPDPVAAEVSFGAFHTSCELDGPTLRLQRRMELKRTLVPADEFAAASQFFDRVRSASGASVVMAPATRREPASSR